MDDNIAFNYDKIDNLVTLQNNQYYCDVLEYLLEDGRINGILKTKFNLNMDFDQNDIISLLFYFDYLTIERKLTSNMYTFKIPNLVMEELYNMLQLDKYSDDSRIDKNSLKKLVIIFVGMECKEIMEV